MITVYYSERIQINASKRKRHVGEVQEKKQKKPCTSFQFTWTHIILLAMRCNKTCEVSSAMEAHQALASRALMRGQLYRCAASAFLTSATQTSDPQQKQCSL